MGAGVSAFSTCRDAVLPYPVVQAHQTHGTRVEVITRPGVTREELEGVDALVTAVPGVAIGARTADCIPVLLHDPVHNVASAIHSGWRGTVAGISACAIDVMRNRFGTDPGDLVAVIGPGIRMDSFQVGEELVAAFREAGFPMDRIWEDRGPRQGTGSMAGGHHLNLPEAVRWTLVCCGIPESNISDCGIDTYLSEDFFSARRDGTACGRIINSIMLL